MPRLRLDQNFIVAKLLAFFRDIWKRAVVTYYSPKNSVGAKLNKPYSYFV